MMLGGNQMLRIYRWLRWPLLLLAAAGLILLAAWRLTRPDILQWDDFAVYWAAGRLNASGQNPYDVEPLLELQRQIGRSVEELPPETVRMWNPPWALVLFTPFGMLPYPLARALWFLLQMSALAWSAEQLWLLAGGSPKYRLPVWLLVLSFGPTLQSLKAGQGSPLLLFALLAFLSLVRQQRGWAAGAAISLLLLKPQVCYLVLAGIVLQAIRSRRWTLIAGLVGVILGTILLTALMNPIALSGGVRALLDNPAKEQATPTLGAWLRFFFGTGQTWLQFLPPVLGLLWLLWDILRRPTGERWGDDLPRWVLVSLLTMPFGWVHDHIVALVALVPAGLYLGWRPRVPLWWGLWVPYIAVNAGLLFIGIYQFWYIWLAPFWLLWAAMARKFSYPAQAG